MLPWSPTLDGGSAWEPSPDDARPVEQVGTDPDGPPVGVARTEPADGGPALPGRSLRPGSWPADRQARRGGSRAPLPRRAALCDSDRVRHRTRLGNALAAGRQRQPVRQQGSPPTGPGRGIGSARAASSRRVLTVTMPPGLCLRDRRCRTGTQAVLLHVLSTYVPTARVRSRPTVRRRPDQAASAGSDGRAGRGGVHGTVRRSHRRQR